MDSGERRQMLLARQYLTASAEGAGQVCSDLNGLQAQLFSYTRLSLAARLGGALPGRWEAGLCKTWTVRGTLHLVTAADLPVYLHRDRRRFLRPVDQFAGDELASAERKACFAQVILDSVDRGADSRESLRLACRSAGMTAEEERSLFDGWGGLLRAMAEAGQLCHRPTEEKRFFRCPPFVPLDRESALLEQARRYFTHFGPATIRDAAYFFALPQGQIRALLEHLPVEAGVWQGQDCFWIDDGRRNFPAVPECLLLAGFDPLLLGFAKKEGLFVPPEFLRGVFSPAGMVLPCLLVEGQGAARWKRRGGTVSVSPFRIFTPRQRRAAEEEILRRLPETRHILWQ